MGAIKLGCQADIDGRVVAVVIEGGPVSRVESVMMDDIVSKVSVFGGHAVNVEIRRCTFEEYEAQWTEHDTTVRDPFGKFTGGFEGSFADVNTFFGGLDSLIGEPQKNVVRLLHWLHLVMPVAVFVQQSDNSLAVAGGGDASRAL